MKRLIVVALVATSTLAGTALAQERAPGRDRAGQTVFVAYDESGTRVPARRCSGVGCLQSVPSLGVAF